MIETPRLLLRPWMDDDAAPFRALCADDRVMATLGGTVTAEEADARRQRLADETAAGIGVPVIADRASGRFLGYCGLKPIPADNGSGLAGEIEAAWGLVHDAWGQGIAREAAAAVFDAAPNFPIWAYTAAINHRSFGLMERLGMVRRADLDFDHLRMPPGHPLRPHIVYQRAAG